MRVAEWQLFQLCSVTRAEEWDAGSRVVCGRFGCDRVRLERYARALVERQGPPESRDDFLAREAELSAEEGRFQSCRATG